MLQSIRARRAFPDRRLKSHDVVAEVGNGVDIAVAEVVHDAILR